MKKTAFVLGLGPSLFDFIEDVLTPNYKPDLIVGVNDICRFVDVDILVCVDTPQTFNPDRLAIIKNSKPGCNFLSHLSDWSLQPGYERILLTSGAPTSSNLFNPHYWASSTSTYVAVQVAARLGFKEIVMYGVDLTGHKVLSSPDVVKEINIRYLQLAKCLKFHDINLYIGSDRSALKLPVWDL